MAQRALDRTDAVLAAVAGLTSFGIYVRTLAPGLLPGDSGELQLCVYTLGDTHPTGYPVYQLLARLVTLVAPGDPAHRVNLASAVFAAVAVGLVYLLARACVSSRIAAVTAAFAFALCPTFWAQAVIAEVYTCAAMLALASFTLLLTWDRTGRPAHLALAAGLGGLALGAQMTVGLLAPAALLCVAQSPHRGRRAWLAATGGALAGLLVTLAAFWLVASRDPPSGYIEIAVRHFYPLWGLGETELDGTLGRIRFLVSGKQFSSEMFRDPVSVMPVLARQYVTRLPAELSIVSLVLAALGLVHLAPTQRKVALTFGAALLAQWLYGFNYAVGDTYVFFVHTYWLTAVLVAAGLEGVLLRVPARGARLTAAALMFFALLPMVKRRASSVVTGEPMPFSFPGYPSHPEALVAEARALVPALRRDAIVFASWGHLNLYLYVASLELNRGDLRFYETWPALETTAVPASAISRARDWARAGRAVYFTAKLAELETEGWRLEAANVGGTALYALRAPP